MKNTEDTLLNRKHNEISNILCSYNTGSIFYIRYANKVSK